VRVLTHGTTRTSTLFFWQYVASSNAFHGAGLSAVTQEMECPVELTNKVFGIEIWK
jgi:hypothetical protein